MYLWGMRVLSNPRITFSSVRDKPMESRTTDATLIKMRGRTIVRFHTCGRYGGTQCPDNPYGGIDPSSPKRRAQLLSLSS